MTLWARRRDLELRTERLILRAWRDGDREPFAALNADPVVMEHFPAPLSRVESDRMVDRIEATFAEHGLRLWAVEVVDGPPFIGFTGLQRPAFMPEFVEVGWRLARAYWGAGYATEAARAAVDYAFDTLGLPELISMTVPSNVRSQRVMAKLGFVRDRDADFEHPNVPVGSPMRAHWLFRLRSSR